MYTGGSIISSGPNLRLTPGRPSCEWTRPGAAPAPPAAWRLVENRPAWPPASAVAPSGCTLPAPAASQGAAPAAVAPRSPSSLRALAEEQRMRGDIASGRSVCYAPRYHARQPRLDAPDTLHHVMVRGLERRAIFREDPDCVEIALAISAPGPDSRPASPLAASPRHVPVGLRLTELHRHCVNRRPVVDTSSTFQFAAEPASVVRGDG
jgi:hypothetical protein